MYPKLVAWADLEILLGRVQVISLREAHNKFG